MVSADEMMDEVKKLLPVDIVICAAAVSDFKPKKINKNKVKKNSKNSMTLELIKNQDILNFLGKNNKLRPKIVVGFSAETENLVNNSMKKLEEKHCDLIIANDVSKKDSGFNSDYNEVFIIQKNGKMEKLKKSKKTFIASVIAEKIMNKFLFDKKNIN